MKTSRIKTNSMFARCNVQDSYQRNALRAESKSERRLSGYLTTALPVAGSCQRYSCAHSLAFAACTSDFTPATVNTLDTS